MTNLRRDIHSAFEVIAPPVGGMPERVVQTVLAEKNGRLRKERMVFRLRVSLALVAAVLIAAVGVAAVMEWNALHGNVSSVGVGQNLSALQQLEARSVKIASYQSRSQCKNGPSDAGGDLGSGPLYAYGNLWTTTDWGSYFDNYLFADSSISGPILVRARDVFTNQPVVFINEFASGLVAGRDVVAGVPVEQRSEAVVFENKTSAGGSSHKYFWHLNAGAPKNWSGSTGWQIDGPGFSETFYAC